MKRILLFIMAITFSLAPFAQKHSAQKKPVRKTAVTAKKKAATPARKTNSRSHAARKTYKPAAPTRAERKAATYSNASIRGLQGQRASIRKKIREQEQALQRNKADVKKRLEDLMALNGEIDQRQKKIDGIQKDIHHIDGNIGILQAQLKTLQQQLQDRKNKYIRSMRYMSRHHTVQDKLMFIFSAKNLTQMYRRLSFIRQYSSYQKVQGEAVKAKQKQVNEKHQQLQHVKGHKNTLLYKGKQEKTVLEGKQTQQQVMVQGLQKQQKTIQAVIADQRQKKIDGIQKDIHHIDGNIGILQAQLKTLQQQLQDRKNKYIRSMRYMSRHHTVQDKLMFIFSAKNLTQMYRRLSFIRQYSSYQKEIGRAHV